MSTLTARLELPPVAHTPRAARHVVDALLEAWSAPHDRDDAVLVVNELVSNVVDHVGGEASLVVEVIMSDGWLRVSVADGSAVCPVVQELSGHEPRGRGMQVVAALAARWGCEDHHGGKRVWVELPPVRDRQD